MGHVIVLASVDPETGNPHMICTVSEDLLCPYAKILEGDAGKATCFRTDLSVKCTIRNCKWFNEQYKREEGNNV